MKKLLIIDDESAICSSLGFALEDDYQILSANSSKAAMGIISQTNIDIALIDLRLGSDCGIDLLKQIKQVSSDTVVILMTAFGSIESSVKAIKEGAFYYITKPINIEQLNLLLEKAQEYIMLNSKIKYLTQQVDNVSGKYGIIGSSKKMNNVFNLIEKVKDIDTNVMIIGESGTGKELVARAIHYEGSRKDKPFNVVNCPAIPGNLLESELFGFKKGSFTGAMEDRKGIIELSDGGTLFLDEVGDIDISIQAKLLRVLQEKKVSPIGSNEVKKVDIRLIAATNKDLEKEVELGNFREDLYYRLNVIGINTPPLRERRDDITRLVWHFINKYNVILDKKVVDITSQAVGALEKYRFNGNVRELENIIERAVALTDNNYIDINDLPSKVFEPLNMIKTNDDLIPVYIDESLKDIEKKVIKATLGKYKSKKKTAQILGLSERALRYKVKEYEN